MGYFLTSKNEDVAVGWVAVAGGHNLLMIGPPGKAFICNVELWREAA